MFCGKTEELIRRLRRAIIARKKVQVFKPAIDNRYTVEKVHSHAGMEIDAVPIDDINDIYKYLEDDTDVIGIDEAQFFSRYRDRRRRPRQPREAVDLRRVGYRLPRRALRLHADPDGEGRTR